MMNPRDWYCFIGNDDTRVWSSATNTYVPANNQGFMSKKGPDCPGKLPDEAELWEVMQANAPGFLPDWLFDGKTFSLTAEGTHNAGQLKRYAADTRWRKEQSGIVSTAGFPVKTDDSAQVKIIGMYLASAQNPALTIKWHAADGVIHLLDAASIAALKDDLLTHINNCFDVSADMIAGIDGGGITTPRQIDAAFGARMSQERANWLKP